MGCLLLSLAISEPVLALESDNFRFSGFASLAAGKVNDPVLRFGDYSNQWSVDTDTVLGLQGQARLADRLSLTGQVLSRGYNYNSYSDYEPQVSWLFLSYQMAPDLRIRAGRLRTPHYLYSDTLEVGYSYVWVRPPIDVYTPVFDPLANFNGTDFTLTRDVQSGDWLDAETEMQFYGGVLDESFNDIHITGEPLFGANLSLRQGFLKLRYALMALRADIYTDSFAPLTNGFQLLSTYDSRFEKLAQDWTLDNGWYYYHGLGLQAYFGPTVVTSEWYYVEGPDEGFSTYSQGWYLSIQYSVDRLTPYIVVGAYKNSVKQHILDDLEASYEFLPAGQIPAADALRSGARFAAEGYIIKERTLTLGFRLDLLSNLALKGEWQQFIFSDDSSGNLYPEDGDPSPTDATSMVSFTLDLVF
ncbi:MAG: hypothetical protein IPM37_09875 [Hahellaceae bacterium]|nr:hypothetical protein [Hahellaceae bacterium]